VSGLNDVLHRLMLRFARPAVAAMESDRDDAVDGRLTSLEQKQREIAARLRILEKSGNPRGIGHDE
jgi:hypothetical protein